MAVVVVFSNPSLNVVIFPEVVILPAGRLKFALCLKDTSVDEFGKHHTEVHA